MDELSAFVEQQASAPQEAVVTEKKKRGKKADGEKTPKPPKEPKVRRDNIEYVKNLPSLAGVRKFMQIAIAKKAKSVGKVEATARYDKEIEASKERLAELLAIAEAAENPIAKLVEMDEEPNKVITHFIRFKEAAVNKFEADTAKMPKSILKTIGPEIPTAFFEELGIDLVEPLETRHKKNDYRLQAVCRAFNFMAAVDAGLVLLVEGKYKTKESLEAKVETKVEVAPVVESTDTPQA